MTVNEAAIRRYLLGEARDEEQEQTERRLMTDRDYFQDFLRIEEALIDEYARGALSKRERERFEDHFIKAPERRESLEFAKALRRYVTQGATQGSETLAGPVREAPPVFFSWRATGGAVMAALACVALLSVACAAWLFAERARLKGRVEQLQTELAQAARSEEELRRQIDQQGADSDGLAQRLNQARAELDEKEREIERLRQEKGPGQASANAGVVAMLLTPELQRGGEAPRVAYLSKGSDRLRLKMVVDRERYKQYRAEVRTAEGLEILSSAGLRAKASRDQTIVEVEFAAGRLAQGDYMVALSGTAGDGGYERISTYHFRVVRR